MGFLEGLSRFLSGKPVFEAGSDSSGPNKVSAQASSPADPTKTPVDAAGYKIIPKIELSHAQTHRNGQEMTTTVWVNNASDQKIRVEHSYVLGQKQQFNRDLEPGVGHEITVYRGPVATDEHKDKAQIVYKLITSDDLFQDDYFVEFARESDGVYLPEEFHEEGPTRDV